MYLSDPVYGLIPTSGSPGKGKRGAYLFSRREATGGVYLEIYYDSLDLWAILAFPVSHIYQIKFVYCN